MSKVEENKDILCKKYKKKTNEETGWVSLILKEKDIPLESNRTKGEFTIKQATVSFIFKGYCGKVTEEMFNELKAWLEEEDTLGVQFEFKNEGTIKALELFNEQFDIRFIKD